MAPKPLYWQYCPKCGAVIALYHYPFNYSPNYTDDVWRELDALLKEHQCPHGTAAFKAGVLCQQEEPAEVTPLGPQEPPDDPMIYNRRQADGTFRSLAGFWERDEAPPAGGQKEET